MSDNFSPYKQWLGINTNGRPNYFMLLGLKTSETDVEKIASQADSVIAKVRKQKPGNQAAAWTKLIDELEQAKQCLIDPKQRSEYLTKLRSLAANRKKSTGESSKKAPVSKPTSAPAAVNPLDMLAPKTEPAKPKPKKVPVAPPAPPVPTSPEPMATNPAPVAQVQSPTTPPNTPSPVPAVPATAATTSATAPAPAQAVADPMSPVPDPTLNWQNQGANYPAVATINAGLRQVTSAPTQTAQQASPAQAAPQHPVAANPAYAAQQPQYQAPQQAQPMAAGMQPNYQPAGFGESIPTTSHGAQLVHRRRNRGLVNSLIAAGCMLVLIGGIVGFFVLYGDQFRDTTVAKGDPNVISESEAAELAAKKAKEEKAEKEAAEREKAAKEKAKLENENNKKSPPTPPVDPDPMTDKKDEDDPPKPPVNPDMKDEKKDEDTDAKPDTPKMDEETPKAKRERYLEMQNFLIGAKQDIFDRKLDNAKTKIEAAEALAKTDVHVAMVGRAKLIHEDVIKFWAAVVKSCGKLTSDDTIELKTTEVRIVESSEKMVTYRSSGGNVTQAPMELPIGLAMAFARREFDEVSPEFKLMEGSIYAIDAVKNPSRSEKAQEIWDEAALVGADPDSRIPYLTDNYSFVDELIEKSDVPELVDFKKVEPIIKTELSKELGNVRTEEERVALSKKIYEMAIREDDIARRYAFLMQSIDVAGKSGNPPQMVAAVDNLGKWFKADVLEEKAKVLLASARRIPKQNAAELFRSSFDLIDEALRGKKFDVAEKALTTAKQVVRKAAADAADVQRLQQRINEQAGVIARMKADPDRVN